MYSRQLTTTQVMLSYAAQIPRLSFGNTENRTKETRGRWGHRPPTSKRRLHRPTCLTHRQFRPGYDGTGHHQFHTSFRLTPWQHSGYRARKTHQSRKYCACSL